MPEIRQFDLPRVTQAAQQVQTGQLSNRINQLRLQDAEGKLSRQTRKREIIKGATGPGGQFNVGQARTGMLREGDFEGAFNTTKIAQEVEQGTIAVNQAVANLKEKDLANSTEMSNILGLGTLGFTTEIARREDAGQPREEIIRDLQPAYKIARQELINRGIPEERLSEILDPDQVAAQVQISKAAQDAIVARKAALFDQGKRTIIKGATIGEETATLQETKPGAGIFKVLDVEGKPARGKKKAGVEITLGKPASPGERKAIAETRATLDELQNLKALFDDSFVGPVAGRVGAVKNILGLNQPKREALIAASAAFRNSIIKSITGAAMSEPEAKRIMKQLPSETDAPSVWLSKWEQSIRNLETINKRRAEVLRESGLRVPEGTAQTALPTDVPQGATELPENVGPGGGRVFRLPDGRIFESTER